MTELNKVIRDVVWKEIKRLQFQCDGCFRLKDCEEGKSSSRYCAELIDAALLGVRTFEKNKAPQGTKE